MEWNATFFSTSMPPTGCHTAFTFIYSFLCNPCIQHAGHEQIFFLYPFHSGHRATTIAASDTPTKPVGCGFIDFLTFNTRAPIEWKSMRNAKYTRYSEQNVIMDTAAAWAQERLLCESIAVKRDQRRRTQPQVRMRLTTIIHSSSKSALIYLVRGGILFSGLVTAATLICVVQKWKIQFDFWLFCIYKITGPLDHFDFSMIDDFITYQVHNKPEWLPLQCNAWPSVNCFSMMMLFKVPIVYLLLLYVNETNVV